MQTFRKNALIVLLIVSLLIPTLAFASRGNEQGDVVINPNPNFAGSIVASSGKYNDVYQYKNPIYNTEEYGVADKDNLPMKYCMGEDGGGLIGIWDPNMGLTDVLYCLEGHTAQNHDKNLIRYRSKELYLMHPTTGRVLWLQQGHTMKKPPTNQIGVWA